MRRRGRRTLRAVPGVGSTTAVGGTAAERAAPPELSVRTVALLAAVLANGPGRLAHVTIRDGGMAPLLLDGDVVTVEPGRGRPRLGAVMIARAPAGDPLCLRVVDTVGGGWVLAGDSSDVVHWCAREAIIGRVAEITRGRRRLRLGSLSVRFGDAIAARCHGWAIRCRRSRWRAARWLGRGATSAIQLLRALRSRLEWLPARRATPGWLHLGPQRPARQARNGVQG